MRMSRDGSSSRRGNGAVAQPSGRAQLQNCEGREGRHRSADILSATVGAISMSKMNYQEIITSQPGKRGGRPTIRGMRIAVADVARLASDGDDTRRNPQRLS